MNLKSLWGLGIFILALNAGAAQTTKLPKFEGNTEGIPSAEMLPYSKEDYKKETAAAISRSSRALASSANFEAAMSDKLKSLRSEILAIRSSDQLDQKMKELSVALEAIDKSDITSGITNRNLYKGADRDYRYYASQIVPLQCLKGIVWRFTPLAEKSSVVESRLVTNVYRLSQSMQVLTPQIEDLPTPEARQQAKESNEQNISYSVFDYLTKPYDGAVLFSEGYDLQEHLVNSCYTALRKSAERIERLDLSTPIVWDNKMYFGVGTFPDDLDRYKLLGEAERHFALAMKHAGMHFISFYRAYSIKDYFKLQTELGKLYVQDSFPNLFREGMQGIEGVLLQKKTAKIKGFSQTYILYGDGAKYLSEYSWPHLVRSVQELNLTWTEVKDKPENQRMVINPAFLNAFRHSTDETLKTWNRVIEGKAALHSRLTDRVVTLDLQNFYKNPPRDLKSFLPVSFDTQTPKLVDNKFKTYITDANTRKPVDAAKKYQKYRNWYYGEPTSWDAGTWRTIFPELKSGNEVPESLRTMTQAWGGSVMALPLMQFIR